MPDRDSSIAAAPPSDRRAAWSEADLTANPHEAGDKADRVQRMFACIAHAYDLNNRLHSFGRDQAWRRQAVRLVNPHATDDVLDVACGTGDLAFAFARAEAKSVTGVDFTEEMLEIARRKGAGISVVQFVHGDATDLPFEDDSFDIVSIAFGIRNVGDPARALREFRRVLRPGSGRLVVLEFSQPRNAALRGLNRFYTHRVMPLTAGLIARDRSGAYRYLPRSVDTFIEGDAMRAAILDADFAHVQTHPMTFGVCSAYVARVE